MSSNTASVAKPCLVVAWLAAAALLLEILLRMTILKKIP